MNLITNSRNPPRDDGKMVLIEEPHSCLRACLIFAVVLKIVRLKSYRGSPGGGGNALTEGCRLGVTSIVFWSPWSGYIHKLARGGD